MPVGKVTSAVYSRRLERNIALAIASVECAEPGTRLNVVTPGCATGAMVVEHPFYDPKKKLAAA